MSEDFTFGRELCAEHPRPIVKTSVSCLKTQFEHSFLISRYQLKFINKSDAEAVVNQFVGWWNHAPFVADIRIQEFIDGKFHLALNIITRTFAESC